MRTKLVALRLLTVACLFVLSGCGDEYNRTTTQATGGKGAGGSSAKTTSKATGAGGNSAAAGNSSGGVEASTTSDAIAGANASGGVTSSAGMSATAGMTNATAGRAGGGGTTSSPGTLNLPSAAGNAGRASFHVFLLLGQSNMVGYPKAQPADRVEDARVKVLGYDNCSATGRTTDAWDAAAPPLHNCYTDSIGPGDYFAKTLIQTLPAGDTIGLVPCAINGEKIETFMKIGGSKYASIVQRAKLAQQAGGAIEGILLHQGESNNGDSTWPAKVNTLVTDLRTDLGIGNVPMIAGELLYSGSCAGHNTLINQLPNVVTNAYVVSASGLVVDPLDTDWHLHFDHDSQVALGKRYAEKFISIFVK